MFRPAFGVLERILLRRFCSQTTAAGARLLHQHCRSNVGAAAATAGRNFGFFRRSPSGTSNFSPHNNHRSQTMAIVALSTISVALGYMSKNIRTSEIDSVEAGVSENTSPSEVDSVEADVVSQNLRPSEIDWVKAGVVSPVVREQNGCGCCWAMAAVASVEASHYLNTKQSISLSVQELIDCDTTNDGCEGGKFRLALKYIMDNGISTESSYPYMAQSSILGCKLNKTAAARISDFKLVDPTEDALEEAVSKQPVIVRLQYTDDLRSYQGGIMDYEPLPCTLPDGNVLPGHAVLIVGYGTTANGVKYWRFKNSWGETWGEGGFGRIRRHIADERGVLGMFTESAVYPVLDT